MGLTCSRKHDPISAVARVYHPYTLLHSFMQMKRMKWDVAQAEQEAIALPSV